MVIRMAVNHALPLRRGMATMAMVKNDGVFTNGELIAHDWQTNCGQRISR